MKVDEPITILIPIKDGIKFVLKAIQNIESNISDRDEILVIDDGSVDGTSVHLANWSKKNSNVQILFGPSTGLVNALNLGLKHASNDWIARFDVDDGYSFNRLSEQRKWINKSVSVIFSDYEIWSENDSSLGTIHGAIFHPAVSLSLITSSRTPHPGALLNRRIALEVGGYISEDFPAEDLSLWLRMSRFGALVSVPESLLNYKIHDESVSSIKNQEMKEKTKELIMSFGINSKDLAVVERAWKEIYADYRFFSHTSERRILFLRDLIALSKLNQKIPWINRAKLKISIRLLCNPLIIYRIIRMKYEQSKRNRKPKVG